MYVALKWYKNHSPRDLQQNFCIKQFFFYNQSDAPQRQIHDFFYWGGGGGGRGGPIFDSENTIETLFVANYFIPNTVVSTLLAVTCFNQFI